MLELVSSIGQCSVCTLMLKRTFNAALVDRTEAGNKKTPPGTIRAG